MPVTLTFKDINEANLVMALIGTQPYNQVAELVARLKAQIAEQLTPPGTEPAGAQ